MPEDLRPDPDALLAAIRSVESRARRGRLKVFFGMCPGVGKTYAMLEEARRKVAEGVEVVVGIVETHGRAETQAMIADLPVAPRVEIDHRGAKLSELDLDALKLWRPKLVLVDELAHTNAPGSRHPKRYQDVLELLDAGIDIFTTLNVQHVESRSDAVRQITGITVRETVPDSVLDAADEIELIDLTPEQLRIRLGEGKVYLGERAATAAENFFREENLTALREMALRVTAEHVDRDLRALRQEQNVSEPWKAGARMMVAVGPSPHSEELIRSARRVASAMEASWLAVHVERPGITSDDEARVTRHLALARRLGAEVISTTGTHVGEALLRIARQHNVTQIIVGKTEISGWRAWLRPTPVRWLLGHCGDIDVSFVGEQKPAPSLVPWREWLAGSPADYASAIGIAAAATLLGLLLLPLTGYRIVALIFLAIVTLAGAVLRRGPILVLATLSAVTWDYLFIPPRFTLNIHAAEDWGMFAMFFITAILTGQLTARLRERELGEHERERRAVMLFRVSRALAAGSTLGQSLRAALVELGGEAAVLLPTGAGLDRHPSSTLPISEKEESVAAWSYQNRRAAGRFTDTLPESDAMHLPLLTGDRVEGVLAIRLPAAPSLAQRELLEACAAQFAIAIGKERAVRAESESRLARDSEKLQKALLDSVSHELKTPLAAIQAAIEQPALDRGEIRMAAHRLRRVVDELLDVARIESGLVQPQREWCDIADLIADARARADLAEAAITIAPMHDLPPIRVDAALITHALAILMRNAATHGASPEPPTIAAQRDNNHLCISVADRGPGFPAGDEERIFMRFYRASDATGGLGLGLAIARRLVEVHGGTLTAENRPAGGARFTMRLPVGGVMKLPDEE